MRLNPLAVFDCLYVGRSIQDRLGAFAAAEIHLFSYLGCLLWLYGEHAVSDWGYTFVATELGAPFSVDVDAVIKQLLESGSLSRQGTQLRLTAHAKGEVDDFARLSVNQERAACIDAACATMSAFSLGMVSSALNREPDLSRAQQFRMSRQLLQAAGQEQLYEQFAMLRQCLGSRSVDLRLPAVVWVTALYRFAEENAPGS